MNTDKITTFSGLIAAICAGVAATNTADPVIMKWAGLIGAVALAIKGYFTNKPSGTPPPTGAVSIALLCGAIAFSTGCQSLQDKWDGLSPATQNAAKAAAKLALSFGLSELGQSVKEVRPWQGKLQGIIETTFAKADAPEAIGEALTANVKATVPADVQPLVIAKFKDALTNPKVTASAVGGDAFNAKIASKL